MKAACSRSVDIEDPVGDFFEIVVDRLFDLGVELPPFDRSEHLQRLLDLGADLDAGCDFLGVAEAFTRDRVAAFALGHQTAEPAAGQGQLQCRRLIFVGRFCGRTCLFSQRGPVSPRRNQSEHKVLAVYAPAYWFASQANAL